MNILTHELRERLLAHGHEPEADRVPVVKFFNPLGEGVWLATELDMDGDTLFGLADLGEPEFGFSALRSLRPCGCGSTLGSSVTSSSRGCS